jgi:hypothetical protein
LRAGTLRLPIASDTAAALMAGLLGLRLLRAGVLLIAMLAGLTALLLARLATALLIALSGLLLVMLPRAGEVALRRLLRRLRVFALLIVHGRTILLSYATSASCPPHPKKVGGQ